MLADDLRLEEIIQFEDGAINLHGRRLVLHSSHALAQFRKDAVEMLGLDQGRRLFTRFGFFWGNADAAAMNRILKWDSPMEWLKAGPRMHTLQGAAKVMVKRLDMDPQEGRFNMEVAWYDSGEAEEHLIEFGPSTTPACWMLVGYASGYASFCMQRPIYFIEHQCRVTGEPFCCAVGKDLESWGDQIKPHLPFFQADDIQGKVLALSAALRRQTRALATERRRVARLERTVHPPMVEVHSAAFRRVLDVANRAAPFDSSVLVTGESGVGKEVLVRHMHRQSHRANRPFVAVNCSALPPTLLESELFGHKEGSFTGAVHDRVGLFEEADMGTILLDEIGDVSPSIQVKLLRVLQQREILRVGESTPRKIDVRVMAATNRDLNELVATGRFREDLLYRLRVIEIEVPPLRDRREDILPLARHFVEQLSRKLKLSDLRMDATCLDYLMKYSWPGNVRELENALERAAVLSGNGLITPEYLPPGIVHAMVATPQADPLGLTLAQVEADHIRNVLHRTHGNRTKAAKALGISPSTLWRKLKQSPTQEAQSGT